MKQTTKILNLVYCLTALLFLLDGLTSFDIKSQFLKSFVYFGFLIGTPTILLWNLFSIKTKNKRIIGIVYPTLFLILIFVVNSMKISFSSGSWRTQAILYQNGHLTFKKVEFQMQDIGALGYNKRIVEVIYLTPLFMLTSEVPNDIDKRVEWIKVDKDINELYLKFP
ncbi:MAG: hypothetical protein KF781_02910 [Chitinophagaceae bacterium]|nr:hypothetical protein [Chitinophagaceae bacterium]MCW5904461.1 hypothetical protein [Chitinophagaceae bacterium]